MGRQELPRQGDFSPFLLGRELHGFFPDLPSPENLLEKINPQIPLEGSVIFCLREREAKIGEFTGGTFKNELPLNPKRILILTEKTSFLYRETLETLIARLGVNQKVGIVLIGEEKLPSLIEAIMEGWGLVERGNKNEKFGYKNFRFFWGRVPKERRKIEVDLTAKPWFLPLLRRRMEQFKKQGWTKISPSEILEKCQRSKFPPLDIQNLELGMGFDLTAPCGCQWRIPTSTGEWERKMCCGNDDCDGLPFKERYFPPKKVIVGYNIPASLLLNRKPTCEECGAELLFDRTVISLEKETIEIMSQLKCPHHGSKGKPRKIRVTGKYTVHELKI
ncbi:MAG: hypothetical protein ACPLKP_03810 [Microgenomates group bacterium]